MNIDIQLQWHNPDSAWAAVFMRNGEAFFLKGSLVGMGSTPSEAVENLFEEADHLVIHGENFLSEGQILDSDRYWLFLLLDRGHDPDAIQARYEAMRSRSSPQ